MLLHHAQGPVLELPGTVIPPEDLAVAKARELALYLFAGLHSDAVFLRALRNESHGGETVIFDLRVAVAQVRKHPILPIERMGVTFRVDDETVPDVVSLREDFPHVPHLSSRAEEFPRGLCLYDVGYDALKLRWTAASFIARVQEWLLDTAEGRLHKEDQPLEPLIAGNFPPLLLPATFFDGLKEGSSPKSFSVYGLGAPDKIVAAYALREAVGGETNVSHLATVAVAGAREQGAVRRTPASLKDLIDLCREDGFELGDELKSALPRWRDDAVSRRLNLVLVIVFPKLREGATEVKEWDTMAFVLNASIEQIGEHLGLWVRSPDGGLGVLIVPGDDTTENVGLAILNPVLGLTKARAAHFNGVELVNDPFVMVGLGALGSLLMGNLARKGFGTWKLLDKDILLPHNGARHLLPGDAAGYPKAAGVQLLVNTIYEEQPAVEAEKIDVLHPGAKAETLNAWLEEAEVIVDCSADVPTSRYLALNAPAKGRRVSIFLNPTGEDLVMLMEDRARTVQLDALEMQYYALLLHEAALDQHLAAAASRLRYGRSCRDLSAVLSNDAIARNAATASRALSALLNEDGAQIKVWKGAPDGGVQIFSWPVAPVTRLAVNDVTVVIDAAFIATLTALRAESLPNETGGSLLGHWDQSRKILYLVATVRAPADSVEERAGFIRGSEQQKKWIERASQLTGASVQYVGEWHSHPNGYSTSPSKLDDKLFAQLSQLLALDGLSPLMLIVGEDELRCVLKKKDEGSTWKFQS